MDLSENPGNLNPEPWNLKPETWNLKQINNPETVISHTIFN